MQLIKTKVVTNEESNRRIKICDGYPKLKETKIGKLCGQCGCLLSFKAKLKNACCPLAK